MSSDEDEELAVLRAQRAAKLGDQAGATLSELREKQRQAEASRHAASQYFERPTDPAHRLQRDEDDDDDDLDGAVVVEGVVDDEVGDDDGVRAYLPMSFGKQEVKVANVAAAHSKTKRTEGMFGPPRPPQHSIGPSFGPPRPSTSTAAMPAGTQPHSTGWKGVDGDGNDGLVGPARPVNLSLGDDDDNDGDEQAAGPPRPPAGDEEDAAAGPSLEDDGDQDDDDGDNVGDDDDEYQDPYMLPVSHEVTLAGHERAVVTLDVEHSGNRVVTGSMDGTVRLYDFNGMKADLRSFRALTPHEGHPVLSVSWSPTGDAFLVATGAATAKVYDRDGKERGEFVRGDMYIRDMKNTKGHVSGLTSGQWHPTDRYTAMTASEDGTVRIWDTWNIQQKTVIKPSLAKPGRVTVSSCAYNCDGRLIAAGLMDGTIQLWSVGGKFGVSAAIGAVAPPKPQMVEKQGWSYVSRPTQLVRGAHEVDTEVTSLCFSQDDRLLASRGMDGTLKLWDLRKFKTPMSVFDDLPTNYATTNCCFSPDERLLLTGTAASSSSAAGQQQQGGAGVFVDTKELKVVRRMGMPTHVAAVRWHHRLNQIFVGTGDRRSGGIHVLYDTSFSERGALLCVARAPRRASPFDFIPPLLIKTPHSLPMFREEPTRKRQRDKDSKDPSKARRPNPGMAAGIGRAGRLGTTGGTLLTQHLLKKHGQLVSTDQEMDPREAILRHAEKEDEISRLTAAYAKTQPKPIFAEPEVDEEDEQS
eukprot:jgi/Chrzof1/7213/Cz02g14300.t1